MKPADCSLRRAAAAALAAVLLLCLPAHADESCAALKAEVAALKARLAALEARGPGVAPVSAAAPATSSALPAAPVPLASAQATLPGAAEKPAAVAKVVVEEPYSRTGCSRGLFKGIASAIWQEADRWLDLEKGQTPAEVEAILGVEHYDEAGGDSVVWHYGRCGVASRAQVLFTKGRLADWRPPQS